MPMGLEANSRTEPFVYTKNQAISLVNPGVFRIWITEIHPELLAEKKLAEQKLVAGRKPGFKRGGIVPLLIQHVPRSIVIHELASKGIGIQTGKLPAPLNFDTG